MRRALVVWCALWVGACTTERKIGSTCENGICTTGAINTRIPCLVATGTAAIQGSPTAFDDMCVTDLVHVDADGMAPCRMMYSIGDRRGQSCEGLGFDEALNVPEVSAFVCEIPQLERADRDAAMTATGWYMESPVVSADSCAPLASQRARLNGVLPARGTTWLVCADAFADRGSVSAAQRTGEAVQHVDPESCAGLPPLPQDVSDIGFVCRTRFEPLEGFYTNRTYVDANSQQCQAGVCIVDATRSAQIWPCPEGDGTCVDAGAPDVDNLMYCSCRCNAEGDTSRVACECPSGFSCRDVLSPEAPAVLAGGYCMRESAF